MGELTQEQRENVLRMLDDLAERKRTHKAVTFEDGWRVIDLVQDHAEQIAAGLRIAPIAPEPGEVEGLVKALEDTIAWASGKCPCANEMPDPCTLCGARVDGDRCLAVESVFPRALLTNVCAALAAYKAKEAAQVPTELTPLHMEMLRRGVMYERIGLTDEAGRHLVEIGALRDLRGMGLVDLIHEPELPGPPRPSSFTITEAGRAAYKAKEAGNG